MNNWCTLGLRLGPKIMMSEAETPWDKCYRNIFAHGCCFDGYHVWFHDIARLGLCFVIPSSPEQFALEAAHQFDECYGLAFAQQLKNKDIPGGGSKAVSAVYIMKCFMDKALFPCCCFLCYFNRWFGLMLLEFPIKVKTSSCERQWRDSQTQSWTWLLIKMRRGNKLLIT